MGKINVEALKDLFKRSLWGELHNQLDPPGFTNFVQRLEKDIPTGKEIYPSPTNIFAAYELVKPEDVKVVILGQDPYHNGRAIGLSFGVNGSPIPPSLRNIYKELCDEFDHRPDVNDFDFSLEHWADQGVLLLNTSLTVLAKNPGSHKGLWDFLIKDTFRIIKYRSPHAIYLLWGKYAQGYSQYIDGQCLYAAHPAAEAYGNAGFFGCGHFYEVNERLKVRGEKPIDWFKLPVAVSEEEQLKMYE